MDPAASTPTHVVGPASTADVLSLRLPVRQPFHADALGDFLADHAVPGMESGTGHAHQRVLSLPHGPAAVAVVLCDDHVDVRLQLSDGRDEPVAVERVRRLLDLDVDPAAVDTALGADPLLAPLVAASPGMRVPGSVDPYETAVRTVVGQQVSVAGARTVLGRLVAEHGPPVDLPLAREHGLDRAFPPPTALAGLDPESLPMPRSRGRTVARLARAVDTGEVRLDHDVDPDDATAGLLALPGIGPWTAGYVRMRGLGDPDVLLDTDLVLRRILERHGVDVERARSWSPWRSYAGMHLWRSHTHPAPDATGRDARGSVP